MTRRKAAGGRTKWLAVGLLACECINIETEPPTLDPAELVSRDAGVSTDAEAGPVDAPLPHCGAPGSTIAAPDCAACIETSCCKEAAQCFNDPACHSLVKCVADCADTDCATSCGGGGDVLARALELKSCWRASCEPVCPTSAAQLNKVGGLEHLQGFAPVDCTSGNHCENGACGDCNGDPSDFCETSLLTDTNCGSCGRACGTASCDVARGACLTEQVATGSIADVDASSAGVLWLEQSGFGNSAPAKFLAAGGSMPTTVGSGYDFELENGAVIHSAGLVWGTTKGVVAAPLPPTAGASYLLSVAGTRLLGATAAHVFGGLLGGSATTLYRWDLPALVSGSQLCLSAASTAGVVDADGTLYLASPSGIQRVDPSAPFAGSCGPPQSPALLPSTENVETVAVGASRLAFVRIVAGAFEAWAASKPDGASPLPLGKVHVVAGAAYRRPVIAVVDDEVLYFVKGGSADYESRLIARDPSSGKQRALAVLDAGVNAMAVGPAAIYLATESGVLSTPR